MSVAPDSHGLTSATTPLPVRPDDLTHFRLGRLLLLLDVVRETNEEKPLDLERLGYYDFFAASPFLVFADERDTRRELLLAGFHSENLSYQSSAQRFTNRRERLQHDLALLVGSGTAGVTPGEGKITYFISDRGRELVSRFRGTYARAYQRSARIVARRLNRLTDRRLQEDAKRWLKADALLIDLYDAEPGAQ